MSTLPKQKNNNAKPIQQPCKNIQEQFQNQTISATTIQQQCQKPTTSIQQQCQNQTTTMPKQNNSAKNKQHQYNNNAKTKQQQCQNQVPYNNLHAHTQYHFHGTTTDRKHKTHNNQIPQLFAIAIFLPDFDSSLFTCIVPNVCNLLRKMSINFSWIFIYLLLSHNSNENKMCPIIFFQFSLDFFSNEH